VAKESIDLAKILDPEGNQDQKLNKEDKETSIHKSLAFRVRPLKSKLRNY
jgi:hypothetical protein